MTNLPLVGQVSMQITAAVMQVIAENKMRKQKPNLFPPSPIGFLRKAYREWKKEVAAGVHGRYWIDNVFCGNNSFLQHVREELEQFKKKKAKHEKMFGKSGGGLITGISARARARTAQNCPRAFRPRARC